MTIIYSDGGKLVVECISVIDSETLCADDVYIVPISEIERIED